MSFLFRCPLWFSNIVYYLFKNKMYIIDNTLFPSGPHQSYVLWVAL